MSWPIARYHIAASQRALRNSTCWVVVCLPEVILIDILCSQKACNLLGLACSINSCCAVLQVLSITSKVDNPVSQGTFWLIDSISCFLRSSWLGSSFFGSFTKEPVGHYRQASLILLQLPHKLIGNHPNLSWFDIEAAQRCHRYATTSWKSFIYWKQWACVYDLHVIGFAS